MFNKWVAFLSPRKPVYTVYLKENGYWGIKGLDGNVESNHIEFEAAELSAVALESRLQAKGSRRTRRRRGY